MKSISLKELKEKTLGERGTPKRDQYEHELQLELLEEQIKSSRGTVKITQEQLLTEISKLENK